jgi:hypothetical protein
MPSGIICIDRVIQHVTIPVSTLRFYAGNDRVRLNETLEGRRVETRAVVHEAGAGQVPLAGVGQVRGGDGGGGGSPRFAEDVNVLLFLGFYHR